MSRLKCVRDSKTKKVYCVDPITGDIRVFPAPVLVSPDNVPPCIVQALLKQVPDGSQFELDLDDGGVNV